MTHGTRAAGHRIVAEYAAAIIDVELN